MLVALEARGGRLHRGVGPSKQTVKSHVGTSWTVPGPATRESTWVLRHATVTPASTSPSARTGARDQIGASCGATWTRIGRLRPTRRDT